MYIFKNYFSIAFYNEAANQKARGANKMKKKLLAVALAASLFTALPLTAMAAESTLLGDANSDGVVSIADVTMIQRAAAEAVTLTDAQKKAADVNGDGAVDISDATLIQQYLADLKRNLLKQQQPHRPRNLLKQRQLHRPRNLLKQQRLHRQRHPLKQRQLHRRPNRPQRRNPPNRPPSARTRGRKTRASSP